MTEHVLKTLAPHWYAVERGDKTFEVRRDDRGFQKGDMLVLRRALAEPPYDFDLKTLGGVALTGDRIGSRYVTMDPTYYDLRRRITYVLTGGQLGIEPGYVVLGLSEKEEQ